MGPWPLYAFCAALAASFLLTAWLLGADLLEWARGAGPRRALAARAAAAALFLPWQPAFSGVPLRGGYDNDHDFQYLGQAPFGHSRLRDCFSGKEVSPLLLTALGDAASGNSLAAVPALNSLLVFLAALLMYAFLRRGGLGGSAAAAGGAFLLLDFLSALNARTVSTTPANLFYLCAALYAAAAVDAGRRGLAGFAAALGALFLVWAGRYELAPVPAFLLAASLARREGGAGRLLAAPGRRAPALALAAGAAFLCAAWYLKIVAVFPYNGPQEFGPLQAARNFVYQFWSRDLGLVLHLPSAAAWALTAGGFALVFLKRPRSADGRPGAQAWAALLSVLFLSAVFMPLDEYPLQFMRHQLYFLVPFAWLAGLAWSAAWGGRAPRARWAALAALCALYLWGNVRAARSFDGSLRTNDLEWQLLLKASGAWPPGCALDYAPDDSRRPVLLKYFPLLRGDCSAPAPSCVLKYVSAPCQIFSGPGGGRAPGCSADWLPPPAGTPAFPAESSFAHRFYTIFLGSETRAPVRVKIGFYRADSPADRARTARGEGLCALKAGLPAEAGLKFAAALRLDPACRACAADLAAAQILEGSPVWALTMKRVLDSGPEDAERPLLLALGAAARGDHAEAERRLDFYTGEFGSGEWARSAAAFRKALGDRLAARGRGGRDGHLGL